MIGCAIIPVSVLNWAYLSHCRPTEKLLSMLNSFHSPASPQIPYFSISCLLHTTEDLTGCQSDLLKQTEAVPTPATGRWLSDTQEEGKPNQVCLDVPLFPKVLPQTHLPSAFLQ